ncbi:putative disease resistance RPP13-like protein 2 [Pistacia vera]|uniref:putative disease resistance RPP13-like protein 2 n=1 Tax=Pistacia vera TaxID=55513 RepID=UPI001263988F|nr:putative disease resistance RPP13-like protein 2 [Pistacia vera]
MKNLQTLKSISVDTWIKTNPEGLVNLRELHIKSRFEKENEFTFDSIAKLKTLQILRVEFPSCTIHSLQPLSNCENLVELTLSVALEKLPEEMPAYLPNLEYLELTNCKLNDDPMPTLEKLPNLTVLYFAEESYCFRKLVCSKGGFRRLEILVILGKYFEELQVAEGAMPELRSFLGTYLIIPERLKKLPLPAEWEYGDAYQHEI